MGIKWNKGYPHKGLTNPDFCTQLSSCSDAYESVCLAARIAAMHLWRCLPHDGLSMFQTLCQRPRDQTRPTTVTFSTLFGIGIFPFLYILICTDGEIPSTVAMGGSVVVEKAEACFSLLGWLLLHAIAELMEFHENLFQGTINAMTITNGVDRKITSHVHD